MECTTPEVTQTELYFQNSKPLEWIWVWPGSELYLHSIGGSSASQRNKGERLNNVLFLITEPSHLELQLWECTVLLSHMAWLHDRHSYCMPSGASWHPFPANHHPMGTGTGICCYSLSAGNTLLGRSSKVSPLSSSSSVNHPNDFPLRNDGNMLNYTIETHNGSIRMRIAVLVYPEPVLTSLGP